MISIKDLFGNDRVAEKYKPSGKKSSSERATLVGMLLKKINKERVKKGFEPMMAARLAGSFEGIPTEDLYALDPFSGDLKAYWKWIEETKKAV